MLAIDPGRGKWGAAVATAEGRCLLRAVIAVTEAPTRVRALVDRYRPVVLVLGGATGREGARRVLERLAPELPIVPIDERGTTLEAREAYFRLHPPRGWQRLVPRTLLSPPVPVDGFAAEILAMRYLQQQADRRYG